MRSLVLSLLTLSLILNVLTLRLDAAIVVGVISGSADASILRANGDSDSQSISGGSYPHIMGDDVARAIVGPFGGPIFDHQSAAAGSPGQTPLPTSPFWTRVSAGAGLMEAGASADATARFEYSLVGIFSPNQVFRFSVEQEALQQLVLGENIGVTPIGPGVWGVDAYASLTNSVEIWQDGLLVWSRSIGGDSMSLTVESPAQRAIRLTSFPEFHANPITGELDLRIVIGSVVSDAIANIDLYRFQAQTFAQVELLTGSQVPEPSSFLLFAIGIGTYCVDRRRGWPQ